MTVTEAEQRARKYAKLAEELRLESEIKISTEPAIYYPRSKEVLVSACVIAWVYFREPLGIYSNRWSGGWRTIVNEDGSYGRTRWIGGFLHHGALSSLRDRKFRWEARFSEYTQTYSYRKPYAEAAHG